MEYLFYSVLASLSLFFLYKTDVLVEYIRLFRLNKLFLVDKYDDHLIKFPANSYWDFLMFDYNNFLTRLLSCPVCFGFWINAGLYYMYQDVTVLILNIWMTYFLYFILCTLYNKSHE